MPVFESLLVLLLAALILSAVARWIRLPYPALLAVGGAVLAFLPTPLRLDIPPDLILALFVAPVLLDAAYDTSLRDLRRNWAAVSSLSLVAVVATTAAVAVGARLLIPDLPWAAAVALGALVAPPDAVAALAVLRQVNPPQQIRSVLEGESLLNDASSLLIYGLAVAAVATGGFSLSLAAASFTLVFVGSGVIGWIVARVVGLITARIQDAPSSVIFQFITTFGVWIMAERLHLSAVVTVVVFGLTLARKNGPALAAHLRIPSFATWESATFVLNVLAFTLVGLQLRPILDALSGAERFRYMGFALVVLVLVIAVRLAWVMIHHGVASRVRRPNPAAGRGATGQPTIKDALVVGWSGMRGIVTLAAAMALPLDFPYRDFIQLTAFVVVLGTLLLQGLTLGPLLRWLELPPDTGLEDELALARQAALRAALASLEGDNSPEAVRLREDVHAALAAARSGKARGETPDNRLRRGLVTASRKAIEELRTKGAIGDTAFRHAEEQLDWLELSAGRPGPD